jgi:hypothetical protein
MTSHCWQQDPCGMAQAHDLSCFSLCRRIFLFKGFLHDGKAVTRMLVVYPFMNIPVDVACLSPFIASRRV